MHWGNQWFFFFQNSEWTFLEGCPVCILSYFYFRRLFQGYVLTSECFNSKKVNPVFIFFLLLASKRFPVVELLTWHITRSVNSLRRFASALLWSMNRAYVENTSCAKHSQLSCIKGLQLLENLVATIYMCSVHTAHGSAWRGSWKHYVIWSDCYSFSTPHLVCLFQ